MLCVALLQPAAAEDVEGLVHSSCKYEDPDKNALCCRVLDELLHSLPAHSPAAIQVDAATGSVHVVQGAGGEQQAHHHSRSHRHSHGGFVNPPQPGPKMYKFTNQSLGGAYGWLTVLPKTGAWQSTGILTQHAFESGGE